MGTLTGTYHKSLTQPVISIHKQSQILDYFSKGQGSQQMGETVQTQGAKQTSMKPNPSRKPWATKRRIRNGKPLIPKGVGETQLTLGQTLDRNMRREEHQLVTDTSRDNNLKRNLKRQLENKPK